jgi:hypothetical protein
LMSKCCSLKVVGNKSNHNFLLASARLDSVHHEGWLGAGSEVLFLEFCGFIRARNPWVLQSLGGGKPLICIAC